MTTSETGDRRGFTLVEILLALALIGEKCCIPCLAEQLKHPDAVVNQMAEHAAALGANGVVGVRYDANEIMPGVTEVLCYGTAVIVQSQS